jgi:hypothetical protein
MVRTIGAVVLSGTIAWTSQVMAQIAEFPQEVPPAGTWEIVTGLNYSVGSYGTPFDTTVIEAPVNLSLQLDRLRFDATIPYMRAEGPDAVVGGAVVPGSGTRSGLGDLKGGAAWLFYRGARTGVEIQGNVKIPTAGSDLGTDKVDYGAGANIYHLVSSGVFVYGSVGYHWLGDYLGVTLLDGVFGRAGASFRTSERTSLGVMLMYRQKYRDDLTDRLNVMPSISWDVTPRFRMTGFGLVGLTESSPDYGFGLRLGVHGAL